MKQFILFLIISIIPFTSTAENLPFRVEQNSLGADELRRGLPRISHRLTSSSEHYVKIDGIWHQYDAIRTPDGGSLPQNFIEFARGKHLRKINGIEQDSIVEYYIYYRKNPK